MKIKTSVIIICLLVLAGFGYYWRSDIYLSFYNLINNFSQLKKTTFDPLISEIGKQVSVPPPLRLIEEVVAPSSLTHQGVFDWTNEQRANNGLVPFKENALLNQAATLKAQDMLKNQYFEHVSPTGAGPGELADRVGYNFIGIGENLATGNYKNDQTLVQAWMDSPGHRANILNTKYTEIGVAVVRGTFEGRSTWMAVQEFGLPLAACPKPNEALKTLIKKQNTELEVLAAVILIKKSEIEAQNRRDREAYIQKVREYNDLVNQYNALLEDTKALVLQYNAQVQGFNTCAQ